MAGSARWGVVGLACLLVVLGLTPSVVEAILLEVNYPQTGNYSYVTLTCKKGPIDDLMQSQIPARFLRGVLEITFPSDLVTVTTKTSTSISFVFNQTQEGSYTCTTRDGEESNVENLSGTVVIHLWQYYSGYILVVCVPRNALCCRPLLTSYTLFSQPCHQPPTIHQCCPSTFYSRHSRAPGKSTSPVPFNLELEKKTTV